MENLLRQIAPSITGHLSLAHTVPGKVLSAVLLLVTERYLTLRCLVLQKMFAEEQLGDSKRVSFSQSDKNNDVDYERVPAHRDPKIMGPNVFSV